MKIVILCVLVSIITSVVTTRVLTIKYFDVIEKYTKSLFRDTYDYIRNTTFNK